MTKLGFFGAMNRDVVVHHPASALSQALGVDAPPLLETPVSDDVAARGADTLQKLGAADYLGGSAFNTARVVALLDQPRERDLAFFGIAGAVGGRYPHLDALSGWSVSTAEVERSPLPPAPCLAMVEPAGRTLLTAHGANAGIAAWLQRNATQLAKAIAGRDLVHVTSFLDPETPGLIADILAQARALNPALMVSLDPGMAWIAPGGEGLARLLRQTGILHLNAEEFAVLGGRQAVESVGAGLASLWTIVARSHDSVAIYAKGTAGDVVAHELPVAPLPRDVRDATGAGDTFCGGFLWNLSSDSTQPLAAARFGFALARAKIALDGPLSAEAAQMLREGAKKW